MILKDTNVKFSAIFFAFFLFIGIQSQTILAQTDTEVIRQIETIVSDAAEDGFSGVVLFARDGEILYGEAHGFANIEWQVENTLDTKFRIGVLTQQFTAMAILTLVESGELALDDTICDYLFDCGDGWQEITIFDLLVHTSGLPIITVVHGEDIVYDPNYRTRAFIETLLDEPLIFEPHTQVMPNFLAYILLGEIIGSVSGMPYSTYLERTFFEPLGMNSTGYEFNNAVIPELAAAYTSSDQREPFINMNILSSVGALYSSATDLLIWNQALYDGGIISFEILGTMWQDAANAQNGEIFPSNVWQMVFGVQGEILAYGLVGIPVQGSSDATFGHTYRLGGFAAASNYHRIGVNTDLIILSNLAEEPMLGLLNQSLINILHNL